MNKMNKALSYFKRGLYFLWKEMPWEQHKLRKKASQFVLNYSDEGDARLTTMSGLTWLVKMILSQAVGSNVVPVTDRQYEYAYVVEKFREYNIRNKDILDIGSSGSILPTILAALGNWVICIDVRKWPVVWENLEVVKCELADADIAPESIDIITCISTIEHVGLSNYGDQEDIDGDIKGIAMLRKYLKPKGKMILTTPFGKAAIFYPYHRIYDNSRFSKLTSGFSVLDKRYFGPIDKPDVYRPCSEKETYSVDTGKGYAIICCLLEKEL